MLNLNLQDLPLHIESAKLLLMLISTYFISFKLINIKLKIDKKILLDILVIVIVTIITMIIRYKITYFLSIIVFTYCMSALLLMHIKCNYGYCLIVSIFSISINYIILFIDIIIDFSINCFYMIQNDYYNFLIICVIHIVLIVFLNKIKRFRKGISFIKREKNDDFFEIIILNISLIIFFSCIIFANTEGNASITRNLFIGFIFFAIIMFITIQKSIQAYYKQKLLIQDLTETKKELEEKKKELTELEKENLNFSMKSHSIAHKQKSLEYKLNKILQSSELSEEIDLKDRMESVAKEVYAIPIATKLIKTEVENIDDMLEFMQAECVKNNIGFDLKINGNIHKMINNYIEKDDLEILLADHIKDAIIAINHTDNVNRSILVKLGEFDNCYSINIYDSGVNFPKEVLENLGKRPITSYTSEGGTGMGYMNTFKTLKKYKASLIIEEFGKPSKDNFTKVVTIKFDKKNEFKFL